MLKISVIIPVYNVENYLSRCLDSVLSQTLKDIEIICINDCSTDKSLEILKNYAQIDNRIIVINFTKNQGVSAARNSGIDRASGEYIVFLDPDDWWNNDTAEIIYNKISQENADIVQFAHSCFIDGNLVKNEILTKINNVVNGTDYNEYFCDFVNLIWDKIYRATFIKDKNIKFPLNIHPTEDVLFALECFSYKPKIIFLPECLYNYHINRKGSAMKNYDKLVLNQIEAANIMFKSDFYKNADNEFKKICIQKVFGGLLYFCVLTLTKKCPMKIYMSQLRALVSYVQKEVPEELTKSFKEFSSLEHFTLLRNSYTKR